MVLPLACNPFPQVLLEVLSAKARSVGSSEEMLRECMKVAANAWALKTALDALDDWTIDQVRPEAAAAAAAAAAAQVRLPQGSPCQQHQAGHRYQLSWCMLPNT